MDEPDRNIPKLAETAQVSASRAAAAVQRDNHPKKRRVLTIRGCPFAGKVSSTSEALGKMVVEALQADDVYPKFAHDEWAVQIKLNSTGAFCFALSRPSSRRPLQSCLRAPRPFK